MPAGNLFFCEYVLCTILLVPIGNMCVNTTSSILLLSFSSYHVEKRFAVLPLCRIHGRGTECAHIQIMHCYEVCLGFCCHFQLYTVLETLYVLYNLSYKWLYLCKHYRGHLITIILDATTLTIVFLSYQCAASVVLDLSVHK